MEGKFRVNTEEEAYLRFEDHKFERSLVGVIKSKPGEGIIGGYIRGVNGMEEEKMAEFSS